MIMNLTRFMELLKQKKMNIKTALRLFGYLMFASLVMTSCEKEAIDPLSGIYTPATSYSLTTLSSQSKTKTSDGQYNIFSINVTDDSGNVFYRTCFLGDTTFQD